MSLKQDIKTLLLQQSGLSSTEIAEVLHKDRNNVRAAAKELVRDGELTGQDDGGRFRFYPVADALGQRVLHGVEPPSSGRSDSGPVIEADFRELPSTPSTSRAVALVPKGSAHPYDSRTEAALRQHARARQRPQGRDVARLPNPFFAAMNGHYAADPFGDEALAELAREINANTKAIQSAQDRAELNHAADIAQQRVEAANREEKGQARRDKEDTHQAIMMMLGGWGSGSQDEPEEAGHTVGRNAPNEENTQSPAEPVHEDEDYEELDPLDDIDELPPIDFKLYHNAKTEQRRQAASADYGDDDFVELTDDAGRVVIKPTLPRMSLGDLLEFEKIRRAEEAVQRERGAPPVRRPSAVRELLGKSKRNGTSTTMPEADAQPQAPRSSWNWLWKRFATPKKSTWR